VGNIVAQVCGALVNQQGLELHYYASAESLSGFGYVQQCCKTLLDFDTVLALVSYRDFLSFIAAFLDFLLSPAFSDCLLSPAFDCVLSLAFSDCVLSLAFSDFLLSPPCTRCTPAPPTDRPLRRACKSREPESPYGRKLSLELTLGGLFSKRPSSPECLAVIAFRPDPMLIITITVLPMAAVSAPSGLCVITVPTDVPSAPLANSNRGIRRAFRNRLSAPTLLSPSTAGTSMVLGSAAADRLN